MAPRSSSPTAASPAHTASPCTGHPPTAPTGEQHWGHHGRHRRELGPLWGRQCRGGCLHTFPASRYHRLATSWIFTEQACLHGEAATTPPPHLWEMYLAAWTKHPTNTEDKHKPSAASTALLHVAWQPLRRHGVNAAASSPWRTSCSQGYIHRFLPAEVCIILGCTWERDSATWTAAAIP